MTTTLADLPVWALIAGGIVIVVAVMTRLGRRRHAAARAAAFRNAAEETRT